MEYTFRRVADSDPYFAKDRTRIWILASKKGRNRIQSGHPGRIQIRVVFHRSDPEPVSSRGSDPGQLQPEPCYEKKSFIAKSQRC